MGDCESLVVAPRLCESLLQVSCGCAAFGAATPGGIARARAVRHPLGIMVSVAERLGPDLDIGRGPTAFRSDSRVSRTSLGRRGLSSELLTPS